MSFQNGKIIDLSGKMEISVATHPFPILSFRLTSLMGCVTADSILGHPNYLPNANPIFTLRLIARYPVVFRVDTGEPSLL
jgi:hypothetical protein